MQQQKWRDGWLVAKRRSFTRSFLSLLSNLSIVVSDVQLCAAGEILGRDSVTRRFCDNPFPDMCKNGSPS